MSAGARFYTAVFLVALGLGFFPLLLSNPYYLNVMAVMGINALVVTGLNLLIGYAGQISLGHAAFVGLGAYISGVLTASYEWDPWLTLVFAALCVGIIALVIGIPTLRLKGNYLVMATLGFNLVVNIVIVQMDEVTGGPSGFSGIPALSFLGFEINTDLRFYYLIWLVVLAGLCLARNLVRSRVGRGLMALHDSQVAAAALGVPVEAYKVKVFVLSAVYASVAGSLYAHYFQIITPKTFDIFRSVELVTMCIIGGMGSLWGALAGAAFLTPLPQVLHIFEQHKDIFYGAILMLVLIFLPGGLAGLRGFAARFSGGRS